MISVIFSTRSENFKSFGGLGKKKFLTCESLGMTQNFRKSWNPPIIFDGKKVCSNILNYTTLWNSDFTVLNKILIRSIFVDILILIHFIKIVFKILFRLNFWWFKFKIYSKMLRSLNSYNMMNLSFIKLFKKENFWLLSII